MTPEKTTPRPGRPAVRFSPSAWAKLLYLRDAGPTEVGAFGLSEPDDPLRVLDVLTVAQCASIASVRLADEAVADFFDAQVDAGRRPEQFARLWIHTHPGNSAEPSSLDFETFDRVFSDCDWSAMIILARGGQTSARLRFGVGPGGQVKLPVEVDYSRPFPASDEEAWGREYRSNVRSQRPKPVAAACGIEDWPEVITAEDLEAMDEAEQRAVLCELGLDDGGQEEACLW